MLKAIMFDFDGVIVDTELKRFSVLRDICKRRGLLIKESTFPSFLGEKSSVFLHNLFPRLAEKEREHIASVRRKVEREQLDRVKLVPGIKKVIEFCIKNRLKISITSGSHRDIVLAILKQNKLENMVDVIVSGDEFKTSKPNPECYLMTLKKLKLWPGDVIVIEDAPSGIYSANAAGIKTIGLCTYLDKKHLSKAKYVCKDPGEVIRILTKLTI